MEEVKKRRKFIRIQTAKLLNKEEALRNTEEKVKLEVLRERLKEKKEELKELDKQFITLTTDEDEAIETDCEISLEYEEKILEAIKRIEENLKKKPNEKETAELEIVNSEELNTRTSVNAVRLPKLELPTFDGDIKKWMSFWQIYEVNIHKREDLAVIEKLSYLLSLLRGEAARIVSGFSVAAENYEDIVNLLHEQYDHKNRIVDLNVKKILEMKPVASVTEITELKNLITELSTYLRNLSNLGIEINNCSAILNTKIKQLIPADLLLLYERQKGKEENATEDLIKFLQKEINYRENVTTICDRKDSTSTPRQWRPPGDMFRPPRFVLPHSGLRSQRPFQNSRPPNHVSPRMCPQQNFYRNWIPNSRTFSPRTPVQNFPQLSDVPSRNTVQNLNYYSNVAENSSELILIETLVQGNKTKTLLDSGSSLNIVTSNLLPQYVKLRSENYPINIIALGTNFEVSEYLIMPLKLGEITKTLKFYYLPNVCLPYIILSINALGLFNLNINFKTKEIYQGSKLIKNFNCNNNKCNNQRNDYQNVSNKFGSPRFKVKRGNYQNNSKTMCKESSYEYCSNLNNSNNDNKCNVIPCNSNSEIDKVIQEFDHIFAKNKFDVGEIKVEPPKIVLTSELPISQRPYRTSPRDDAEIKKQLDSLLETGIIKPSHSQYASPITLAFKKEDNARTRLCVDYRKLNQITKSDCEPIPRIDSVLDKLTNAKFFSTLDLCSGYWHIKLEDKEAEKLAFTSNFGLFQFTRLPFGFKNAPAIFQRAIRCILHKYRINFALNYFDDIIIFSNSLEEHIEHLRTIFEICEKENIKLKESKCHFAKDTIDFLGYEIKHGSYSPNNVNVETIKKLLPPRNVKDLQRFLGTINVYHKFIPNYAKIRIPLNNLLKKDKTWEWTPECQNAFQKLKDSLISKPILALYNPNYPCHVYVDASKEAIASIVKQEHPDGTQHPIAYHSRRLRPYEINYTITELECLAIIDSLDKFHCYLHGSHFTVHTDHHSLVWLKSFKNPTGRLFRWSLKISMYDFDIKYKKGVTNVEADMLTRNPIAYNITTFSEPLLDKNEIIHFQGLENISAPRCFTKDNLIVVKRQGLIKIVVPKALRVKIMEKVHEKFGHPGIASMLKIISPQYYWTKIITDVGNYVKHCETCQINKKSHQKRYGFMQSLPLCEKPFELLSMDTVGGLFRCPFRN